jgi:hypothetical protein
VVVLLSLAVLAAGTAGPAPRDPGRPIAVGLGPAPSGTPSPLPPDPQDEDPTLARTQPLQLELPVQDVVVVGVLVVGALLTLLLRRRRERPGDGTPARVGVAARSAAGAAGGSLPLLDRALAAAEAELAARPSGEPRDAVLACWLRLEEGAEAVGVRRRPSQTPTEFTTALVADLLPGAAQRRALDDLRALYHRARFGSVPLDADAPQRAAAALATLRAGLLVAGPPPAAPGAAPGAPRDGGPGEAR